ncbi:MAG: ATP-binding cassette domain-containing protein [Gammaproteobacteria bacterium]|nr:ATP-binding cassette domain-containing protein [Gammaproteobacteria bacterium]
MIELKQLCKTYEVNQRKLHALQDIHLSISQGEIFGIFGESGAGKSTLLRSINLLEKPSSGKVLINGIDITQLAASQLKEERRQMGMIFQHFHLLQSRTVFENIAFPLELLGKAKSEIKQAVHRLLQLIHLQDHAEHYPSQLSGGQQQRVAIARALATEPRILLCDEPTSALDLKSSLSVLALLKEVNVKLGVTIVLITHEMDVIKRICHRAAVLDQGKLIEQGSVIDLFAKPRCLMTKQLVQKSLHIELPESIQQVLQPVANEKTSRIVRFTFVGDDSNQPLITTLVQQFAITVNIIQANIETIQDATIGFTVCQLSGDTEAIDKALAYVRPTSITAEVLGYV